jgi:hypothetical protein
MCFQVWERSQFPGVRAVVGDLCLDAVRRVAASRSPPRLGLLRGTAEEAFPARATIAHVESGSWALGQLKDRDESDNPAMLEETTSGSRSRRPERHASARRSVRIPQTGVTGDETVPFGRPVRHDR